jgi:hypothetical protein
MIATSPTLTSCVRTIGLAFAFIVPVTGRSAANQPDIDNWGFEVNKVRLSLSIEREFFQVGEAVVAKVRVENNRDTLLVFSALGGQDLHFPCILIDERKSAFSSHDFKSPWNLSSVTMSVRPHSTEEWNVRLDKVFNLEQPGSYLAYVKKSFPPGELRFASEVEEGGKEQQSLGRITRFVQPENLSGSVSFTMVAKPGAGQTNVSAGAGTGLRAQTAKDADASPHGSGPNPASPNTKFRELTGGRRASGTDGTSASSAARGAGTPVAGAGGQLAVGASGSPWQRRDLKFGLFVGLMLAGTGFWLWSRHRAARPQRR